MTFITCSTEMRRTDVALQVASRRREPLELMPHRHSSRCRLHTCRMAVRDAVVVEDLGRGFLRYRRVQPTLASFRDRMVASSARWVTHVTAAQGILQASCLAGSKECLPTTRATGTVILYLSERRDCAVWVCFQCLLSRRK